MKFPKTLSSEGFARSIAAEFGGHRSAIKIDAEAYSISPSSWRRVILVSKSRASLAFFHKRAAKIDAVMRRIANPFHVVFIFGSGKTRRLLIERWPEFELRLKFSPKDPISGSCTVSSWEDVYRVIAQTLGLKLHGVPDIIVDDVALSIGRLQRIRPFFDERTALEEVPRAWLEFVEPKIKRDRKRLKRCWIWQGAIDGDEHPVTNIRHPVTRKRGKYRVAHLVASIFYQLVPRDRFEVTHACGNLTCLNPAHLKINLSTAQQRYQVGRWDPNEEDILKYADRKSKSQRTNEVPSSEIGEVRRSDDDRRGRAWIDKYQKRAEERRRAKREHEGLLS